MTGVEFIKLIPIGAFFVFVALQSVLPRRQLLKSGKQRIIHNVALFLVNSLLMKVLVPVSLITASLWAANHGSGVFNLLALPSWLAALVCVVLLDLAIYGQHVATHRFPLLWRMHKVHHADTDMDVSTAVRFHPVELILSLGYKSTLVVLLGAPVSAVIIFELLLFVGPAFNHSNIKLPTRLDTLLRWVIATPDTHRAHHSTVVAEQNTNYGFFLIWWDKLFGTYTRVPKKGHELMPIGLKRECDQCDRVDQMLIAPFR
jgi:sterol desaturase/sphingolipid hydroxylase (fatty acid hydroxylase superfamily)